MEPVQTITGDGHPDETVLAEGWSAADVDATISAVAICMRGPAAASLAYEEASIGLTSGSADVAGSLECLDQDTVGGGAGAQADPELVLDRTAPTTTSWVYGEHQTGDQSTNTLSAVAVCLPTGMKHVRHVQSDDVTIATGEAKTAVVHCPKGTHVSAGGVSANFLHIVKSVPIDDHDADNAPDDGWLAQVYNDHGSLTTTFNVSAVCIS
jgi:hypothetical protein